MSSRHAIAAVLLATSLAGVFPISLNGAKHAAGPAHPWTLQVQAEGRCVSGVRRSMPLLAAFRFRRQDDSIAVTNGWQISFEFGTTEADCTQYRQSADCTVSMKMRRGTAIVTTVGDPRQISIQFAR